MRALAIDFQRRPRANAGGWLLLLAGIATAAGAVLGDRELAQRKQAQEARLARANVRLAHVARPAALDTRAEAALAAARQALDKARLPWNELFAALETAQGSDIALLSVTPDVPRRQLRIQAEARDFGAMLAYHRHLQQQPGLAQVVLVDHTLVKDVPENPVRFQILANWGTIHGQP